MLYSITCTKSGVVFLLERGQTETHRQTDRQTDRRDWTRYPHRRG